MSLNVFQIRYVLCSFGTDSKNGSHVGIVNLFKQHQTSGKKS